MNEKCMAVSLFRVGTADELQRAYDKLGESDHPMVKDYMATVRAFEQFLEGLQRTLAATDAEVWPEIVGQFHEELKDVYGAIIENRTAH